MMKIEGEHNMRKIKYLTLIALATNCFIISDVRGEVQPQDLAPESVTAADPNTSSSTPAKKKGGFFRGLGSRVSNSAKSKFAVMRHNARGNAFIGRFMKGDDAAFHKEVNILLSLKNNDPKTATLFNKTVPIYNQKVDPRNKSRTTVGKPSTFAKYCPIPSGISLRAFIERRGEFINRKANAGPCPDANPVPSNSYPNDTTGDTPTPPTGPNPPVKANAANRNSYGVTDADLKRQLRSSASQANLNLNQPKTNAAIAMSGALGAKNADQRKIISNPELYNQGNALEFDPLRRSSQRLSRPHPTPQNPD